MNLAPLFNAGPVIIVHVAAAVLALLLGGMVLWRRKGTSQHKMMGKVWVGLMVIVSLSSFFIHELRTWGPFSPIHILSVLTLVTLAFAIYAARNGNIQRHKHAMQGTFIGGLVVAGSFSFMPGRIFYRVLFDDNGYGLLTRNEVIAMILAGVVGSFLLVRLFARHEDRA